MSYIKIIMAFLLCLGWYGCTDSLMEEKGISQNSGKLRVHITASDLNVIQTRADKEEDVIESVVLFVFQQTDGKISLSKKAIQYFDGNESEISLFLPDGKYNFYAVCNWNDPDALYQQVRSMEDLNNVALQLQQPDDAYMGKYVMFGQLLNQEISTTLLKIEIPVSRLASFHNFTITFEPKQAGDRFQLTEAFLQNIPRGSWLMPRMQEDPTGYVQSQKEDWVFQESDVNMKDRFFSEVTLETKSEAVSAEEKKEGVAWKMNASHALLENRRGGLPVTKNNDGEEYNNHYWEGSEALANSQDPSAKERLKAMRMYEKRHHALNEKLQPDSERLKFLYATCLVLKGFYQNANGTSEVTYYIYLGADSYKDYNILRNCRYETLIRVKSLNEVDSRVERISLAEATLSASETILDSHFNVVKTVFYSDTDWEVWVEDPDKTPWIELSGSDVYRCRQMAGGVDQQNQELYPCYKMTGKGATLRNIYLHIDEFIPDLKNPNMNNSSLIRTGRVAYRKKGSSNVKYITVSQYPAQLAVLHIKYDVHTMKEVCDTFYIERKLEKKYMSWGLESYWSFVTDDLIASGLWDGLSNTRKLYQVALFGDKWGVKPGYPSPQYNGIPENTALGYIINKNRDRDGNGKVDYDEIMWYFPARKEMQYLHKAIQSRLVSFDASNSIFHCSTPSSADPAGITTGFSYYVKMNNGKYGIGQRDRLYNVLALRRKHNEWSGPAAGDATFTVSIETGWNNEEVIMPK